MAGYLGNIPSAVPLTSADIADGIITSAKIADGTIVNADINASAGIVSTKLSGVGKVLQVITATDSTQRTTTSTTFVTASNTLSVSITPSSTSNKIYIVVTGNLYIDANGGYGMATIFRDATNLGSSDGMACVYGASSTVIGSMSMSYLDSPSTTSATTYQVYFRRYGANNVYIQEPASKSSITAFEIAG
jgi:hypothetical protein